MSTALAKHPDRSDRKPEPSEPVLQADVAIVGAGIVGACTAFWLTHLDPRLSVVLIERDCSFAQASSSLSASSIRLQFSAPVNIALSQFGLEFLRQSDRWLTVAGQQAPALGLTEPGYLYLAQAGEQARRLRELNALQQACGAPITLLEPAELARRFDWLEVRDLALGSLGLGSEGWFDGPALHQAVLSKARAQGARLMTGEVLGFELDRTGRIAYLQLDGARRIGCGFAVNAAGAWAGKLAAKAGIDLPVRARRRTVFVLSCPQALPGCPLVIDPSGFWFRPEGRQFIAGFEPDPDLDDLPLEPNLSEFDEAAWQRLAFRVPAFEALRVERAWAGYYEMNIFDHNAVIGPHPLRPNLLFANGFSGHGMQQAPAAGRALAERIVHGGYQSLDVSALGFERLIAQQPLRELNVIG